MKKFLFAFFVMSALGSAMVGCSNPPEATGPSSTAPTEDYSNGRSTAPATGEASKPAGTPDPGLMNGRG